MSTLIAQSQSNGASEPVELVQEKSDQFNWVFFTVIATFHLGAVAALFSFHWSSIAVFVVLWLLSQNVGIAISYHRQLTHRGQQPHHRRIAAAGFVYNQFTRSQVLPLTRNIQIRPPSLRVPPPHQLRRFRALHGLALLLTTAQQSQSFSLR